MKFRSIRTLICNRQELKPCLEPKFYSLICSLDPVYPLSCLFFIQAEILQQYKERRLMPMWKEKLSWGLFIFVSFLWVYWQKEYLWVPVSACLKFSLKSGVWEGAVSTVASSFFQFPTSTAMQPCRQERGWRGMPLTAAALGLLALLHLQSPWGGWRISWSSFLLPAPAPASSKGFVYQLLYFPDLGSPLVSLSLSTSLGTLDLGEGSIKVWWVKAFWMRASVRVSPWRWKALHSMEICKRACQCQVVFTQVASSYCCFWSSPLALSEMESWIRLLKET